jgi:hypothetical protein
MATQFRANGALAFNTPYFSATLHFQSLLGSSIKLQPRSFHKPKNNRDRESLPVARVAVAGSIGFLTAHIRAVLGLSVPTHTFLMVNATLRVQPHDGIRWAVGLSSRLAIELWKLCG